MNSPVQYPARRNDGIMADHPNSVHRTDPGHASFVWFAA
jgi:hypothetical protein